MMHPSSHSYKAMVKEAEASLILSGNEAGTAMLLLEDLFGMNRTKLMMYGEDAVKDSDRLKYETAVKKVAAGEPYQYVTGFGWFYGYQFKVTSDTLIPRNETEELVEFILSSEADDGRRVADIGCGTGAIGLTLQKNWQHNEVILTEVSEKALKVAQENAERLDVSPLMLQGDLFEPIVDRGLKVDCLVSNPPYISYNEREDVGESVMTHEPHLALFAEDGGLALYKAMIDRLPDILNPGGTVYFEIGWKQYEALEGYVKTKWPSAFPQLRQDMNGKDRILYFKWED